MEARILMAAADGSTQTVAHKRQQQTAAADGKQQTAAAERGASVCLIEYVIFLREGSFQGCNEQSVAPVQCIVGNTQLRCEAFTQQC